MTDSEGKPVANAVVEVEGIAKNMSTSLYGEYWRLLPRGEHRMRAVGEGEGALRTSQWVTLTTRGVATRQHVRQDFVISQPASLPLNNSRPSILPSKLSISFICVLLCLNIFHRTRM